MLFLFIFHYFHPQFHQCALVVYVVSFFVALVLYNFKGGGVGLNTGPVRARQALYLLNYTPSPFVFILFFDIGSH
jgi:hypothetical protein